MFEEYRASDETSAAWRALADRVREVLYEAGIANHFLDDLPRPSGAEISIDYGANEMGGVFVDWRTGAALSNAVMEAAMERRNDDPAIELYMSVKLAMRDAMIKVLEASGFEVNPIDDYDMRPPAIHVIRS
jgi:hypothetical protein